MLDRDYIEEDLQNNKLRDKEYGVDFELVETHKPKESIELVQTISRSIDLIYLMTELVSEVGTDEAIELVTKILSEVRDNG